jgi:hypothetical protein
MTFRHFFDRYEWGVKEGGFTMAVDWDRKVIGFAFCSPKDQYCKKTGRDLASRRVEEQYCDGSIIVVTMPRAGNRATKFTQRQAIIQAMNFINLKFPNTQFGFTFED